MLTLHTDMKLVENWPVRINKNFNWTNQRYTNAIGETPVLSNVKKQELLDGEWVLVSANNEMTRISEISGAITKLSMRNAFPINSNSERNDVMSIETLPIIRGFHFTATTDRCKEHAYIPGDLLAVEPDNRTDDTGGKGGWLKEAESGDVIRAVVLGWNSTTKHLTFRFLDGHAVA